jgi:hypothetical protein
MRRNIDPILAFITLFALTALAATPSERYPEIDNGLKIGLIASPFLLGLLVFVVKCCCRHRRQTEEQAMPINRLNYGATNTDSIEELTATHHPTASMV